MSEIITEKKKAILQRFLLEMFYPKPYLRILIGEYFKEEDETIRKEMMSRPLQITFEPYYKIEYIEIRDIPPHIKASICKLLPRSLLSIVNYMNDGRISDDEELNAILSDILPRSVPDHGFIYKGIAPIWITPDEDIFNVKKPFRYRPKETFTAYDSALGLMESRDMSQRGVAHVLKIRRPPHNLKELYSLGSEGHTVLDDILSDTDDNDSEYNYGPHRSIGRENYKFDVIPTLLITSVSRNQYGYVILEAHMDIPYISDFNRGGGRPVRGPSIPYPRETRRSSLKASTTTSSSMFVMLSLVIMAMSSIIPR
jgi:hypothetical protein